MVLMKNPQFLANQAQTLAILPNHEMVILAKFHNDRMKIVDFSLIPYFRASPIVLVYHYQVNKNSELMNDFKTKYLSSITTDEVIKLKTFKESCKGDIFAYLLQKN